MEPAPALPAMMNDSADDCPYHFHDNNKSITWYPGNYIVMVLADGTIKTWYAKPTLNEAVVSRPTANNYSTYQFFKDGSVTAVYNGEPYYWSAPISVVPQQGPFQWLHEGTDWLPVVTPCCYESDEAAYDSKYHYDRGVDGC